jgi:arylsulfatase A
VNDDLVGAVDFLPTICEAADIDVPDTLGIDGQSFLPQALASPDAAPRRWLYTWYSSSGAMARKTEFARTKTHKLYEDGRFFDLVSDPYEEAAPARESELTGDNAAVAKELRGVLDKYADARPEELKAQTADRPPRRNRRGRRRNRAAAQIREERPANDAKQREIKN